MLSLSCRVSHNPVGTVRLRDHHARGVAAVVATLGMTLGSGACASGADPESGSGLTSFGQPTATMTTMSASDDDDDTEGDDDDDADTEGDDDDDATGSLPAETGDDDDDDGTEQPSSGMYSHCLSTAECVGLNTCIQIFDNQGQPFDGWCTRDNCQDPVADCDPTPGGDVMPVCAEITLNGMPATACALSCAGGLTCPSGMICYEEDGVPYCA